MNDDRPAVEPDEPDEHVEISMGRVWTVGQVRSGQARMDWKDDANDQESDDQ